MASLLTCLLVCTTACFAMAAPVESTDGISSAETESNTPRTVYYAAGDIATYTQDGVCYVTVTTEAYQKCHVYHDVTIYKNGTWVSSERFEDWSVNYLTSTSTVSVKSGDRIEVYVDHYAENEGGHSSKVSII